MSEEIYEIAAKKITMLMPRIRRLMHSLGGSPKNPKVKNIPPVQFFVMMRLSENGPLTMGEIAKMIKTSKPNLTMLVDRMEKAGLVMRVPDRDDRRVINVALTNMAVEQIDELSRSHIKSTLERLVNLDREGITRLNNAMDEMMDILNKL